MPLSIKNDELDLSWIDEDPDFGISESGVYCKNMEEISMRIAEVKDTVKKINLNNQHALTELPSILGECIFLEELDISNTGITEIPAFLFTLPCLRILFCYCKNLTQPPRGIAKAKKLEKLYLRIKKGWQFPEEIALLPEIKILDFDLEDGISLHKDLGNLKKLEELIISLYYNEGDVPDLPDSFANHKALIKLRISDHIRKTRKKFNLSKAAEILSTCPNFESFKLCGISIGGSHQTLSQLTGLKRLELRHLLVEGNVMESIAPLNKLEKLEIMGSELKISELPDMFGNLRDLQIFSFAGNLINALPPSIYHLTKLTSLEIGSTGISVLDSKIDNLKNLVKLHLYDNLLEKLPETVFSLPCLEVLDIENNTFRPDDIAEIKEKLNALEKRGQRIELMADGQGHRQMVKKLRTLKNIQEMDETLYYRYCLNAVSENPNTIKYIDKYKFHGTRYYAELCMAAVIKNCFSLEFIDHTILDKSHYFRICIEAAKKPDIGHAFRFVKDEQLTNYEYVQVCLEAALHTGYADFLNCINTKSSMARLSRTEYERICWAAVLHYPPAISKMIEPTEELRILAEKRGYKN